MPPSRARGRRNTIACTRFSLPDSGIAALLADSVAT
jgi:hypothetical protein